MNYALEAFKLGPRVDYTLHGDLSRKYRPLNHTCYDDEIYSRLLNTSIKLPILYSPDQVEFTPITCSITCANNIEDTGLLNYSEFPPKRPSQKSDFVKHKKMLLLDVINIMESLLNKNLQYAINLLKHKNINYAYDIANCCSNDDCSWFYRILSSKRHDKYTNSYIYLAVIDKKIVECKLYQVNKEQIYVVTTLQKYERDNIWLKDIHDTIYIDDDCLYISSS